MIQIDLVVNDYTKYREIIDWCNRCLKYKCKTTRFANAFQFEGALLDYEGINLPFYFEHESDAALFKLTWV